MSQSKEAYTTSEENLALMKAEIGSHPEKVSKQIDEMIQLLEPIASSSYSWWDAALIPVREGMEALLVIGALLTMTKSAGYAFLDMDLGRGVRRHGCFLSSRHRCHGSVLLQCIRRKQFLAWRRYRRTVRCHAFVCRGVAAQKRLNG